MQWLVYWLVYPILLLISKMPFWVIYGISDGVYALVYYILGYRKKVVRSNLNLAFPEKSEAEKKRIEKRFYHHFCDSFLEVIKTISITEKEISSRFVLKNVDFIKKLEKQGQSAVVLLGHYASYEWLASLQLHVDYTAYGIYKPIKNKYFDALMHRIRARWNSKVITNRQSVILIRRQQKEGILATYAFVADQSPKAHPDNYFTHFLGQQVPFFTGVERIAKRVDLPVLYLKTEKVKRGFYETEMVQLAKNPNEHPDFTITDAFAQILEEQIKKDPAYYLWTHKRFKHRK
ncbi:MAG: lysophospholipid acyltransferase family protein [Leeuwenhoekiella sp.]